MKARRIIPLLLCAGTVVGTLAGQGKISEPRPAPMTFVEIGSVKCIPCRRMQPVMKAIEKKYGDQVRVIFHDIGTDSGSRQAEKYNIRLIPTQVFLDEKGKEVFRHEGFYPEAEIHKLFRKRGLSILPAERAK